MSKEKNLFIPAMRLDKRFGDKNEEMKTPPGQQPGRLHIFLTKNCLPNTHQQKLFSNLECSKKNGKAYFCLRWQEIWRQKWGNEISPISAACRFIFPAQNCLPKTLSEYNFKSLSNWECPKKRPILPAMTFIRQKIWRLKLGNEISIGQQQPVCLYLNSRLSSKNPQPI